MRQLLEAEGVCGMAGWEDDASPSSVSADRWSTATPLQSSVVKTSDDSYITRTSQHHSGPVLTFESALYKNKLWLDYDFKATAAEQCGVNAECVSECVSVGGEKGVVYKL